MMRLQKRVCYNNNLYIGSNYSYGRLHEIKSLVTTPKPNQFFEYVNVFGNGSVRYFLLRCSQIEPEIRFFIVSVKMITIRNEILKKSNGKVKCQKKFSVEKNKQKTFQGTTFPIFFFNTSQRDVFIQIPRREKVSDNT